jgi:selenide,water dikinase
MEPLVEMLRGGAEKIAEAGAELAGGHTIDDREPKYGLAVAGLARPEEIVYNAGALPGDRLVLTKRLGIGVLASALKSGLIGDADIEPAAREAAALNAAASRAMQRVGVHAATDVTGFGLFGHLLEMLDASRAAATVWLQAAPLHEGVIDLVSRGIFAGGLRNNRDFLVERLGDVDRDDPRVLALFDPQTSGGLLMAVAAERHGRLLEALEEAGCAGWTIGEVTAAVAGTIEVREGPDAGA